MRISDSDIINGKIDHMDFRNAIGIDCSGCISLTELPLELSAIRIINCSGCPNLIQLPLWNDILIAKCSDCPGLLELPLWPVVQEVSCHNCIGLTELPLWPWIIKIDCHDCPNITELPMWLNIEKVDCHNCPNLADLPPWPKIQQIYCYDCPFLLRLQIRPQIYNMYTSDDSDEDPDEITQILPPLPSLSPPLHERIYFNGDCYVCSSENTYVTKCSLCIWLVCRDCYQNWHVERRERNCMHCSSKF